MGSRNPFARPPNDRPAEIMGAILIDAITILPGRRKIREEEVQTIAESMAAIGLQTPITVRRDGGKYILVTDAHRLAAARKLEWTVIDCVVRDFASASDARLWEIAENLHRADLTVLERAEHIAEWIRLSEVIPGNKPAQVAPVSAGGRGKEGGVNAAARKLGIDRTEAQRAIKIASLPPKMKAAAVKAGKANNQSALLEAAKSAREKQSVAVVSYKSAKKTPSGFAKPPASARLRIMVTDNIMAALYHLKDATKSLNVEMSAGEADAIKEAFLAVGDIARRGAALAKRAATFAASNFDHNEATHGSQWRP
jgi:hypothetical protein